MESTCLNFHLPLIFDFGKYSYFEKVTLTFNKVTLTFDTFYVDNFT